jgi:hypothetical protein
MRNVTSLSVQEICDITTGNLWLLNTADQVVEGGADVQVTVNVNGSNQVLRLPKSWLPMKATDIFPRATLLSSQNLLTAIARRVIMAIPEEEALKILRSPGAEVEMRRIEDDNARQRQATERGGIKKNVFITGGDDDSQGESETLRKAGPTKKLSPSLKSSLTASNKSNTFDISSLLADEESIDQEEVEAEVDVEVSTAFKGWVQKLNTMGNYEERLNAVRTKGTLSLEELEYMKEKVTDTKLATAIGQLIARQK